MNAPSVSVVVVSRGRPDALTLCVTGLGWLTYDNYEIVVISDSAGVQALRDAGFGDTIKLVEFSDANISEARNHGITHAAGDIIAFTDDDAVPEPTWLTHLVRAFDQPDVMAAGGPVIGRNGISFQWTSRTIDRQGVGHPVAEPGTEPFCPPVPAGHAPKTEGTNMAVRAGALRRIGGFDPAFRFYLDESDLNMRLADAGMKTAFVPLARVHHAYAPNANRAASRRVTDLFEIGASYRVFLRKHLEATAHPEAIAGFTERQRKRLLQQMVDGLLEPRDVRHLMARLAQGLGEGGDRMIAPLGLAPAQQPFLRIQSRAKTAHRFIPGRIWQKRRLFAKAKREAAAGVPQTLIILSLTPLYHRVWFHKAGFWVQKGGVWGRSLRGQPLFKFATMKGRFTKEVSRIRGIRAE